MSTEVKRNDYFITVNVPSQINFVLIIHSGVEVGSNYSDLHIIFFRILEFERCVVRSENFHSGRFLFYDYHFCFKRESGISTQKNHLISVSLSVLRERRGQKKRNRSNQTIGIRAGKTAERIWGWNITGSGQKYKS